MAMTNERAIEVLENEIKCIKNKSCRREECRDCSLVMLDFEILNALNIAIDAIEKQIPIKPLMCEMDMDGKIIYPCGNCGEGLKGNEEYCSYCGQAVRWI